MIGNVTQGRERSVPPLSPLARELVAAGGLVRYASVRLGQRLASGGESGVS